VIVSDSDIKTLDGSKLKGEVKTINLEISEEFEETIDVKNSLLIDSNVKADIKTKRFIIKNGVKLNGKYQMECL
jgi:hypothetical protein